MIPFRVLVPLLLVATAASAAEPRIQREVLERLATGERVRVIVALNAFAQRDVVSSLDSSELALAAQWRHVPAFAGEISIGALTKLARNPRVAAVSIDRGGSIEMRESLPHIGGETMFARGFTGAGVTVAVIDTGIDGNHPDFAGRIVDEQCYCFASDGSACCPNKNFEQRGPGAALDEQGHGTNVTGIIASAGTIAPRGIAPGANIVAIRVTDRNGAWQYASQIISALDFLIAHHPEVRVVNISLGSGFISDIDCDDVGAEMMAVANAVHTLRARGTAVFMSSGNGGRPNGVTFPACVSGAFAVGAVYDANHGVLTRAGVCRDEATEPDKVVCFSNSGPNLDFLAPGVFITSTGRGGGTETRGGTSQASPHAAGAAAILFSLRPSLTVDEMAQLLRQSGTTIVDPRNGYARPRINLDRAVAELLKLARRRRAVR